MLDKENSKKLGLLLISENDEVLHELSTMLSDAGEIGFSARSDVTLENALTTIENGKINILFFDLAHENINALEAIVRVHSLYPDLPVIVIADKEDEDLAISMIQLGAQEYLLRETLNPRMLPRIIRYARERQALLARVRSLSLDDELTGLSNLRGFMTTSKQQLKSSARSEKGFQVWFFDIDNMKYINDTYGHSAGDTALIQTATIIENTFRGSDIVARIGGDEFAALAIECEGRESADLIETRLKKLLIDQNKNKYFGYSLSISYGVAQYYPSATVSVEELLAKADRLMYSQKRKKSNAA